MILKQTRILSRFEFAAALLACSLCLPIGNAAEVVQQPRQLTLSCSCSDDDPGAPLTIEAKDGESDADLRDRFGLKCDASCNRLERSPGKTWSPECLQRISNYSRVAAATYTAAARVGDSSGLATRAEQCEHSTRELQAWETSARKMIESGRELATCYVGDSGKRALEKLALAQQQLEASLADNKAKISAHCQ